MLFISNAYTGLLSFALIPPKKHAESRDQNIQFLKAPHRSRQASLEVAWVSVRLPSHLHPGLPTVALIKLLEMAPPLSPLGGVPGPPYMPTSISH